jgi:hypothetical protein
MPLSGADKPALLAGAFYDNAMTLDDANRLIKSTALRMNELYGKVVFDEWAIVSLAHHRARILAYAGPRNDVFLKNFANDLGTLRSQLLTNDYTIGDFEFSRHGVGTGLESFVVLGESVYLFCNNTQHSMDDIARDPKWLSAQVPFAELADAVRANPVTLAL